SPRPKAPMTQRPMDSRWGSSHSWTCLTPSAASFKRVLSISKLWLIASVRPSTLAASWDWPVPLPLRRKEPSDNMTRKQVTIIVGMLLATAAALFVVWNRSPPAAAGDEEHAEHAERKQEGETEKNSESEEREASQESKPDGSAQPSAGKEPREAEASEHEEHGESDTVKLTPEQIKTSGIQLDKAQAAVI